MLNPFGIIKFRFDPFHVNAYSIDGFNWW